jgi:hypothetical protein
LRIVAVGDLTHGIVAVPIMTIMTVMMVVVTRLSVMGRFSARPTLMIFGWLRCFGPRLVEERLYRE